MAGCYGNSPEDRYFERKLDEYLDSLDAQNPKEHEVTLTLDTDGETLYIVCPNCDSYTDCTESDPSLGDTEDCRDCGDHLIITNMCK